MMEKRKRGKTFPILLGIGGVLLLAAAVLLLLQNLPGLQGNGTQPVSSGVVQTETVIQRVSLADAKAAYDAGTAVFLDVRGADSYASSHIQDAVHIPEGELPARTPELDKADWIIPYCT